MTRISTLYGLSYSPWTERARWALDVKQVPYRYKEHSPFLGEWGLRFRARHLRQSQATVPLFLGEGITLGDSFEIMGYADQVGVGDPLFVDPTETQRWRDQIERALEHMRIRVSQRILQDPVALEETAASVVPRGVAGAFAPVAAMGARFLAGKYGFALDTEPGDGPLIREVLEAARASLTDERDYVHGAFSVTDIMIATLLQAVEPVADEHLRLGPATRRVWRHADLADAYPDLLEWRDRLYALHRRPAPA